MTANGVININKPAGWTSQDVCAKLRGRLHTKKTGHTGTLDPMATGVLPVCIGKATRIIEYYDNDIKSYHAVMQLGTVTDTLDITGNVLGTRDFGDVSEAAVQAAFDACKGVISQVPPRYSALKIGGKRAYELAREGRDFEIRSRQVTIYDNRITGLDLERGTIAFDVSCSKGTYIRTICDDIGRELGCGAVMTELTRTASGFFRLEDAVGIEELAGMSDDEIGKLIIPADITLSSLGTVELNDNRVTAFMNGNSTSARCFRISGSAQFSAQADTASASAAVCETDRKERAPYRVYNKGRFLGIAVIRDGELIPQKVFPEE